MVLTALHIFVFCVVTFFAPLIVFADFNGEILLAPPPPNWTPGKNSKNSHTIMQTWVRNFPKNRNWNEEIVIYHFPKRKNDDPETWAHKRGNLLETNCEKTKRKETGNIDESGYRHAFIQVLCLNPKSGVPQSSQKKWDAIFTTAKIISGQYNRFEISRRWLGNSSDPRLPINSPKILARWESYFQLLKVCNTLFENCEKRPESRYSNSRFQLMRPLKQTQQNFHKQEQLLVGLKKLGILSGKAEVCGEDISTLLMKIERMISNVTPNEKTSSEATAVFHAAHQETRTTQSNFNPEDCGEARRRFRAHPTRINSFYTFIESFF